MINGGFPCTATARGQPAWKTDFGDYTGKSGGYIFHAGGKLLYVGETTDGNWGNFGDRLYRHLSQAAANDSRINELLRQQTEAVKVYLLDLEDISMMIDSGSIALDDISKALIMEQILIGVFPPEGIVQNLRARYDELKAETETRHAKRGLWAEKDTNAPWEWRKQQKEKAREKAEAKHANEN